LGLSRNKVAVPEGAAGTPPFWSNPKFFLQRKSNKKGDMIISNSYCNKRGKLVEITIYSAILVNQVI
jgi:hypothetical protein